MGNSKESVILRVSSSRESGYVKQVAGAMTWQLRENGYCKVRAIKTDAVNTAIKSIAIVNQRVSQVGLKFAIDLCLSPAESNNDTSSTAVEMVVYDAESTQPENLLEYRVSGKRGDGKDLIASLAGAIAAPVKRGQGVSLKCIGPSSVYRAVMACCIAKGYIYTNGLEAIIIPSWATLPAIDGAPPVSLVQIDFWGKHSSA